MAKTLSDNQVKRIEEMRKFIREAIEQPDIENEEIEILLTLQQRAIADIANES